MQEFLQWTLNAIRKDGPSFSWMEERRLEWVPLVVPMLKKLLQGQTFVLLCDDERAWFGDYLISSINKLSNSRPFLPIVSLKSLFANGGALKTKEDLDLLENMLSTTFTCGYTFFYVGKSTDAKYQLPKLKDDSFVIAFDEHVQNSFYLSSEDEFLDLKLLQLFRLLNRSIDAVLFAEVDLED